MFIWTHFSNFKQTNCYAYDRWESSYCHYTIGLCHMNVHLVKWCDIVNRPWKVTSQCSQFILQTSYTVKWLNLMLVTTRHWCSSGVQICHVSCFSYINLSDWSCVGSSMTLLFTVRPAYLSLSSDLHFLLTTNNIDSRGFQSGSWTSLLGLQTVSGEVQWIQMKNYYISHPKEITYSLNVCDLVRKIAQRYSSLGEFDCFPHFHRVRS